MSAGDYRTQTCRSLADIDPAEWDALVDRSEPGAVFVRHAWLAALEASGCVGRGTGWMPAHLLLRSGDGRLVAAAPRYRKFHSFGEYVFDWAWADAYERHGLAYYRSEEHTSELQSRPHLVCRLLLGTNNSATR